MNGAQSPEEIGQLAEELAARWQALLTSITGPTTEVAPPWVVGEPDADGNYNGPAYRLRSGLILHTGWIPAKGARAWVDAGVVEDQMDLDGTLELLAAVAEASRLLAMTR